MTLLVHGDDTPDDEQGEQLAARGIAVVDGPVVGLEVAGDALTGVRLASGEVVALDALVVATYAAPRPDLLDGARAQAGGRHGRRARRRPPDPRRPGRGHRRAGRLGGRQRVGRRGPT